MKTLWKFEWWFPHWCGFRYVPCHPYHWDRTGMRGCSLYFGFLSVHYSRWTP